MLDFMGLSCSHPPAAAPWHIPPATQARAEELSPESAQPLCPLSTCWLKLVLNMHSAVRGGAATQASQVKSALLLCRHVTASSSSLYVLKPGSPALVRPAGQGEGAGPRCELMR